MGLPALCTSVSFSCRQSCIRLSATGQVYAPAALLRGHATQGAPEELTRRCELWEVCCVAPPGRTQCCHAGRAVPMPAAAAPTLDRSSLCHSRTSCCSTGYASACLPAGCRAPSAGPTAGPRQKGGGRRRQEPWQSGQGSATREDLQLLRQVRVCGGAPTPPSRVTSCRTARRPLLLNSGLPHSPFMQRLYLPAGRLSGARSGRRSGMKSSIAPSGAGGSAAPAVAAAAAAAAAAQSEEDRGATDGDRQEVGNAVHLEHLNLEVGAACRGSVCAWVTQRCSPPRHAAPAAAAAAPCGLLLVCCICCRGPTWSWHAFLVRVLRHCLCHLVIPFVARHNHCRVVRVVSCFPAVIAVMF